MELGLALLDQNSIMQVDSNVKAVHNLVARLLLKVVKKQADPPHQQDLSGLLPLVRFSHSLMDTIILVLRKALFSMSVHTREGDTTGVMLLLKTFMISTTRSPSSPSPLALSHNLLWMFTGEPPPHNKARICSGC